MKHISARHNIIAFFALFFPVTLLGQEANNNIKPALPRMVDDGHDSLTCGNDLRSNRGTPYEISISQVGHRNFSPSYWGTKISYTEMPAPQVQAQEFYGILSNNGTSVSNNVQMLSDVYDSTMANVFSGTGNQITLAPSSWRGDSTNTYTPPSSINRYSVACGLTYDEIALDGNPSNNVDSTFFEVTDCEFARDKGGYSSISMWNGMHSNGDTKAFELGNLFEIESNTDLYSIHVALAPGTDPWTYIYGIVYEVDQANGSFNAIYFGMGTSTGEKVITSADISSGGNVKWLELPIDLGNGSPLSLQAGEEYIIGIGHYGGPGAIKVMGAQVPTPDLSVFLLDDWIQWYYMPNTPMIRASMCELPLSVRNPDDPDQGSGLSIYPNPGAGVFTIEKEITMGQEQILLELYDINGRLVYSEIPEKVQGILNQSIDLTDHPAGVYIVKVIEDDKVTTSRLIKR